MAWPWSEPAPFAVAGHSDGALGGVGGPAAPHPARDRGADVPHRHAAKGGGPLEVALPPRPALRVGRGGERCLKIGDQPSSSHALPVGVGPRRGSTHIWYRLVRIMKAAARL